MTYREAIQKLQADIDIIYEAAGVLRDAATEQEKETFNTVRSITSSAMQSLGKLDNSLNDNRAQMELGYSI